MKFEGIIIDKSGTRYVVAVTKSGNRYVPIRSSYSVEINLQNEKFDYIGGNGIIDIGQRVEFNK